MSLPHNSCVFTPGSWCSFAGIFTVGLRGVGSFPWVRVGSCWILITNWSCLGWRSFLCPWACTRGSLSIFWVSSEKWWGLIFVGFIIIWIRSVSLSFWGGLSSLRKSPWSFDLSLELDFNYGSFPVLTSDSYVWDLRTPPWSSWPDAHIPRTDPCSFANWSWRCYWSAHMTWVFQWVAGWSPLNCKSSASNFR